MAFLIPKNPKLRGRLLGGATTDAFRMLPLAANGSAFEFTLCRNAIYHAVRTFGVKAGDRLLAPSYHCATSIEPLMQAGVEVDFYRVRKDCSIDIADIRRRIDERTRGLLAIHYFGFPQLMEELRQVCDSSGLYLIEDCAHVLTGAQGNYVMGQLGDVSVFSWRKFLPVYDGGFLLINNPELKLNVAWESPAWLFNVKAAKNTLSRLATDSGSQFGRAANRVLGAPTRMLKKVMPARIAHESFSKGATYKPEFDPSSVNLPISRVSRRIIARSEISSIVAARRRNYRYLEAGLRSVGGVRPVFPELPEGVCPLAFPIDASGTTGVNSRMRAAGIPSFTWEAVVHPGLALDEHPDAGYLYPNVVMLPLHQDLENADLDRNLEVLTTIARSSADSVRAG